jgi:hypothetical protein
MSRFPLVRLSSFLVGLPVPGWLTKQKTYKILVNMEKQKWQRFCTPVVIDGQEQGRASPMDVFSSSFTSNSEDQLLTESLLGGLVEFSMQQKALTYLRDHDQPARVSLGERPWVYTGVEGVCVRASLLYGYLPLPAWLTPLPYCTTSPHPDGLGWDLLVTLSWPLLGEVVRYEGPLRIANLNPDTSSKKLTSSDQTELLTAIQNTYGVPTMAPSSPLQKVLFHFISPVYCFINTQYIWYMYPYLSVCLFLCVFIKYMCVDLGKVPAHL